MKLLVKWTLQQEETRALHANVRILMVAARYPSLLKCFTTFILWIFISSKHCGQDCVLRHKISKKECTIFRYKSKSLVISFFLKADKNCCRKKNYPWGIWVSNSLCMKKKMKRIKEYLHKHRKLCLNQLNISEIKKKKPKAAMILHISR